MFKINKTPKTIALINKYSGYISQSVIYIVSVLSTVLGKHTTGTFVIIECLILTVLLILTLSVIIVTITLILFRKIEDDGKYDRNAAPADFWTILYRFSAIIIPLYTWFVFVRSGVDNNAPYVLIWLLQWAVLFNSFFYNAFLKQYTGKNDHK